MITHKRLDVISNIVLDDSFSIVLLYYLIVLANLHFYFVNIYGLLSSKH